MKLTINSLNPSDFKNEISNNILPFWMKHSRDNNGGFYGAVSNDLQIHDEIPRSSILCARILWTFSAAFRKFGKADYLEMAQYAYDYLVNVFWDKQYDGLYWDVDKHGRAVTDRKHHYAQVFGIYGLSEYYLATQEETSRQYAQKLFDLLETHAYDPVKRGYTEGNQRDWSALEDMRLSPKDMNCRKSMNTELHTLEAYTSLARVWQEPQVKKQLVNLIEVFLAYIIDPQTHHQRLFFDDRWNSLSDIISFGHDIECSWLLWEAALAADDKPLIQRVKDTAVKMAEAVLIDGMDQDGGVFQEDGPQGKNHADKEWWTQAEAVVGFYNAYRLSGDEKFLEAAGRCWAYIRKKLVDRQYGGWIKHIRPDGKPNPEIFKIGPWECPYHGARMCLEMIERLGQ